MTVKIEVFEYLGIGGQRILRLFPTAEWPLVAPFPGLKIPFVAAFEKTASSKSGERCDIVFALIVHGTLSLNPCTLLLLKIVPLGYFLNNQANNPQRACANQGINAGKSANFGDLQQSARHQIA